MSDKKTFPPVYDENSKILILGTFPSPLSFENGFYYGNPRNRFWELMAFLNKQEMPMTNEQKKAFLLKNKIAIWDVLETCDIVGAADSTIKNAVPNDINLLISKSNVIKILCNGSKAYELLMKFCPNITLQCIKMPSTSPANASWSLEKLKSKWSEEI